MDINVLVEKVKSTPPTKGTVILEDTNLIFEFGSEEEALIYWNALNYYLAASPSARAMTSMPVTGDGETHVH